MCPPREPGAARSVRPTVHAMLDQLEPAPAHVIGRLGTCWVPLRGTMVPLDVLTQIACFRS